MSQHSEAAWKFAQRYHGGGDPHDLAEAFDAGVKHARAQMPPAVEAKMYKGALKRVKTLLLKAADIIEAALKEKP